MKTMLFGGAIVLSLVACTTDQGATATGDSQTVDDLARNAAIGLPNNVPIPNGSGIATTISTTGSIDFNNPFFQDLGENGRRCVTCHLPTAGWGITPTQVQEIFTLTDGGARDDGFGLGAIFRTNDGSNSPTADVSTLAKRKLAYNMLLTKGLIRVGIGIPANAEFELVAVDDPYHHASAADLSLFRRPLPSANLKFLSTVMWDGRETFAGQSVHFDLSDQSNGATQGHAGAPNPIDDATREAIVGFETSLAFAQTFDRNALDLTAAGAKGGPATIIAQPFDIGINDNFGDCIDPICHTIGAALGTGVRGAPFNPLVFDIYNAWVSQIGANPVAQARLSVERGQALFNTFPIEISGVSGLNDEAAFGKPATVHGTCTTCHDTPNSGNHSVVAPLNIGLVDKAHRTADMPLYTLKNKTTGETVQVTDPGRALISGKWAHIGRFKGPILRGLAARPPYFHNGLAADLGAAVDFYNSRFNMHLSKQQHDDLVAFLTTL